MSTPTPEICGIIRRSPGIYRSLARQARAAMRFRATKQVFSEAFVPSERVLCRPGDLVEVERWYCWQGPTSVKVRGPHTYKSTCIPFSWVMEMGAPSELDTLMPFTPYSWAELLSVLDGEPPDWSSSEDGKVWHIKQDPTAGIVRHRGYAWPLQWSVVLITPTDQWEGGEQKISRRTVYRVTLEAAKKVLARHWLKLHQKDEQKINQKGSVTTAGQASA